MNSKCNSNSSSINIDVLICVTLEFILCHIFNLSFAQFWGRGTQFNIFYYNRRHHYHHQWPVSPPTSFPLKRYIFIYIYIFLIFLILFLIIYSISISSVYYQVNIHWSSNYISILTFYNQKVYNNFISLIPCFLEIQAKNI